MPRHSPCALLRLIFRRIRHPLRSVPAGCFSHPSRTPLRCAVSPPKSKPAFAGLLICFDPRLAPNPYLDQPNRKVQIVWFSNQLNYAGSFRKFLFKLNCIYPKFVSLLLPSHNCIIIFSMFSFQGAVRHTNLVHSVSAASIRFRRKLPVAPFG